MKFIVLLASLGQSFLACSMPTKNTIDNNPIPKIEEHIQFHIKLTCDLISWKSCEPNGISATVRVNIYVDNDIVPGTYILAGTQVVEIPCGTVHKMTRPEFDKSAKNEREGEVDLVTEYLDKNDTDGSIFKKVSNSIYDTIKDLE